MSIVYSCCFVEKIFMKKIFFKNIIISIISLLTIILFSCNNSMPGKPGGPIQYPKYILSNFMNFWTYWSNDVRLSDDIISYDENDSLIAKDFFLKKVMSGKYLPLKLKSNDSSNYYKLYPIIDVTDSAITENIIRFGELYYQFFKMEGKPLPGFHFADLNGNVYNRKTCQGKVLVLNFWFIGCTACQREMPALNKLVASYKSRNDVLFVSIAPNNANELNAFLEKNPFAYAIIPVKSLYVTDTLNIHMFPTHMIIDKKGLISKIPEDEKQLEIELQKELLK
jgi:thiol-disulfide isomerase/thioredoxin